MDNEMDILLYLYNDLMINIEHTKSSMLRNIKIKNSINTLNNNYFNINCNEPLFNQYISMFEDLNKYSELITNLETLKSNIENLIKNHCNHEWIHDDIDITPDSSKRIYYCIKCEITRK